MAIREIVIEPNKILHTKCNKVKTFDNDLHTLLDDMEETLRSTNGVGIAAPQVGVLKRVVVILNENNEAIEIINPKILSQQGESTKFEGCLSVPGLFGEVTRPSEVKIDAQDRYGKHYELYGEELIARCILHEIEHLNGHIFTEHTDKLYTREEMESMR